MRRSEFADAHPHMSKGLFRNLKKLIHAHRLANGDPILIQQFFVIPETVTAMHTDRYLIDIITNTHHVG